MKTCPDCGSTDVEIHGTIDAYKTQYNNGYVDRDALWSTFTPTEYRCMECESTWK